MNERHGIAIIGLGTVGLRYVEQYQHHDGFVLIGGHDVSTGACQNAADRFDLPIAESAESLIADPAVDLVYIAVPPLFHEHYVDLALKYETALLCEKPLGVDDAQSAAMTERVEAAGIPAAVNFVFGAAPSAVALVGDVRAARDQVHSAELRVHFQHWPRAWQAGATWLRDRDQGGWTREVVSHYLFLLLRLFGTIDIVEHRLWYPPDGSSEQRLLAWLDCGGVPVMLSGSSDSAGPDEVEFTVRGRATSWRLSNWYQYATADLDASWELALSEEQSAGPAAYAAQLDQLSALLRGEPNGLATFREALAVQQIAETLLA